MSEANKLQESGNLDESNKAAEKVGMHTTRQKGRKMQNERKKQASDRKQRSRAVFFFPDFL